ncbi:energy transducer TonB [Marinomonas mediterranea]|jgi:TonB family C-terminal domain|uniref:TonB family protein n=1 Tax=Marinomonas mediterranea (strain ATCC 700492 / JCM 21426 / NBRC 103028 / MMB-1) TaxID=717774 RepID=F2K015_MARM1|nr:energy transducer TonB [Marinomonas mediterranea]ADZ93229.1 TonB family protein [Marinomonas mediterranea MMB-1]WCN11117.1 TonB family protein [Marinomonas mediterranea]WCN15180.1 TonB family protein [Marinomonas mediterranea]WCN19224.1 TonB family protein [Marinomonas mediterranea MMB-1]
MRTADRFSVALFIAITLHVVAVTLVSFDFSLGTPPHPRTLEITLVQHKTDAPKEADFLAQANQLASGTEIRKQKLTTTETAQFIADEIQDITPPVQPQLASKQPVDQPDVIISKHTEAKLVINNDMEQELKTLEEQFLGETQIPSRLSSDIASLEALLDQQRQAYAKRPRIRRLTSVSAKSALDAEYLDNWRKRIERIGNIHYPSEAKRQNLFGQLRLAVILQPNGYVDEIDVLQSSGLRILDDAAMRIVRLSEPFAPFPIEMKKEVDKLEIIRTWKFVPGNQLQSR